MHETRAGFGRRPRKLLLAFVVCTTVLAGVAVAFSGVIAQANVTAPTSPPAGTQLCSGGADSSALAGPSSAPAGAVTIPAGNNSGVTFSYELSPSKTYYLASGTHTLGSSQFSQFQPQNGDTFIGAPGAILNGEGINESAFDGTSTGVTIEHLTIENFIAPNGQMVVNHDGGAGWTIEYNTIANNGGAGVGIGSSDVVSHNCLAANDEYGFSSFGGASNVTLTGNEISKNDTNGTYDQGAYLKSYSVTGNVATIDTKAPVNLHPGGRIILGATGGCTFSWCTNLSDSALNGTWTIAAVHSSTEFTFDVTTGNVATTSDPTGTIADPQVTCGCSGGGKFWDTAGGTVTNNWVHDNGFVGIWADTDNSGFNISGNYIANNWAEGIMYEVSYNASITDNGFVDNAWGQGPSPALGGFPDPGIYISESGSDSRVSGAYGASFSISSNAFVDNWGGVAIYENSNRACGITNDAYCTLVGPSTYTLSSCASNIPNGKTTNTPDYVDNCRWKAQNISVSNNLFDFTPGDIGADCVSSNMCGYNGLFSEPGTTPSSTHNGGWPSGASYPYGGYTVSNNISNHQNNLFANNEYCAGGGASWQFVGFAQGNTLNQSQWTSGEANAAASGDTFNGQDSGSTFSSSACSPTSPPPTTTTTTSPPPTTTTTTSPPPTTTTTTSPPPTTTTTTSPPPTTTTTTSPPPTTTTTTSPPPPPPPTTTTEPPTTTTTEPPTTTTTEPSSTTTTEPPTTTTTTSEPTPPSPASQVSRGYDVVGQDGGVFVFPEGQSGGFYGSLPGIGVKVNDIVGMVGSPNDRGYFLVGADGGVFAFGDAPFLGSLPGLGVPIDDVSAIASTVDGQGYLLVDRHGGVYAFGDAQFEGSLPAWGVTTSDVVGVAVTPSGDGYWLVGSTARCTPSGTRPTRGRSPLSAHRCRTSSPPTTVRAIGLPRQTAAYPRSATHGSTLRSRPSTSRLPNRSWDSLRRKTVTVTGSSGRTAACSPLVTRVTWVHYLA